MSFEVRIEEDRGERVNVCVTHNGYQWSCIPLEREWSQVARLIKDLEVYLIKLEKEECDSS